MDLGHLSVNSLRYNFHTTMILTNNAFKKYKFLT